MIDRSRMKVDLAGQSLLILGAVATGVFPGAWPWFIALLAALGLWQGASALQLALAYEYRKRYPFLWLYLGLLLALPAGIGLIGAWTVLPITLSILAYFIITLCDTVQALQRPRSFWDL